jgi:hypothetical protein
MLKWWRNLVSQLNRSSGISATSSPPASSSASPTTVTAEAGFSTASRDRRPRGIRNNNPGNIERNSIRWKGMAADQRGDDRFVIFVSPQWGIRAMARILLGDWREGQNTVASLIQEWAPPVENNTSAYVQAVANALGVDPYEPIVVPARLRELIVSIIKHENGQQPYPDHIIQLGIDMERSA